MRGNSGLSRHVARVLTSPVRYFIIFIWIAAAVAAYIYLPGISATESGPIGVLAPDNSKAVQVEKDSANLFAVPATSRTIIVQRDPNGLSSDAQQRVIQRASDLTEHNYPDYQAIAGALPIINDKPIVPFARESGTTALTYLFFDPGMGIYDRYITAQNFERTQINQPGDSLVGMTGVVPVRAQQGDIITENLRWVEIATIALTAIIVGVAFRSIGAPVLTLFAAGTAYILSERAVAFIGVHYDVVVPVELRPLLVVLVLAICTDYTVFFLSGTRNQYRRGSERIEASRTATAEVVPLVAIAGLTVAAGASCLILAKLDFLRVLGPTLGGAVIVSLVVVMTLVPATLASTGKYVFWPHVPQVEEEVEAELNWRQRIRRDHPGVSKLLSFGIILLCIALLLAAASGLRDVAVGMPVVEDMPSNTNSHQAATAAETGFAPGIISPTELLVKAPGITGKRDQLVKLEQLIEQQPGVAGIAGPREQPTQNNFGVVLSKSGSAARYIIILQNDPYGSKAINQLEALENNMPDLLRQAGLPQAQAGFAGDTAVAVEIRDAVVASILPVSLATAVLDLILLIILLRSVIAPIYLMLTSALAVAAPLGLTIYAFERYFGHSYMDFYVLVAVAVLLFSLGSDYNLFVVGRIWERAREEPLQQSVDTAGASASHAIRIAAITLSLSFATLALVPMVSFREFAFAMAVGVLIDSFLVRSYLVPALISLVGKASLWPRRAAGDEQEPEPRGQPQRAHG